MSGNVNNKFIRYFKNPLLGISAFSAYGLPNSLVHMPVVIMVAYVGIFICMGGMKALLPVYFIIALYAGRDLVVMSYKNVFIPVAVWGIFISFIIFKTEITGLLSFNSPQGPIVVTAAVALGFVVYVTVYTKKFIK